MVLVVAVVFQHLEFQAEFVGIFCIQPNHGPVRIVLEGLNLLAEPVRYPQVLQHITYGVVYVLHSSQGGSLRPGAEKSVFNTMNVLFEAILVGLFLIPMVWVVEKILPAQGKWVKIFVAGALFHLTAEFTGINKAYILSKMA